MDGLDPSVLQGVAGFLPLVALFIVREIASGALMKAGEDLWKAIERRRGSKECRDSRQDLL